MKSQVKELLKSKLSKEESAHLPSSYDIVGDILIFSCFPTFLEKKQKLIGEAYLKLHKNISVICKKTGKYAGRYRLPKLRIIAGKRRKETTHKENGVRIRLHVENVYFSSRSSNERQRIAGLVNPGETILVMFSGAGPFPLVIEKNASPKSIVGIEINPIAHKYAEQNLKLNKSKIVTLYHGDVRDIIPKLDSRFDRVLMPLPKGAEEYLDIALKAGNKGAVLHYYDFLNEKDFHLAEEKVRKACAQAGKDCIILGLVRCGQYAPGVFRICLDVKLG